MDNPNNADVRFKQSIHALFATECHSTTSLLNKLSHQRWVLAVQCSIENSVAFNQLLDLLNYCGYRPSYVDCSAQPSKVWLNDINDSPFVVLLIPSELSTDSANGLVVHTLVRSNVQIEDIAGAKVDEHGKWVAIVQDAWAEKEFSLRKVGQIERLPHNNAYKLTNTQQLAMYAAHHVGVTYDTAIEFFTSKST